MHITLQDSSFQQNKHISPKVKNTTLGYKSVRRKVDEGFEEVEYDLYEILHAEDIEAYFRQANLKKRTLFFKEGWDLVGSNEQTVTYINKRLRQIAEATNISTHQLLVDIVDDLIKFSNAFLYLIRDDTKSGGTTVDGRKPIAGIFVLPTETVQVKTDKKGQITGYRQKMPDGTKKSYSVSDIIHFAIDRKKGYTIGTPRVLPVLDDIRSLRRLEENIEILVHKDLFPIYLYRVGTETRPCKTLPDGRTEVDLVRSEIENLPPEGIFVVPERHDIVATGAEGRALRAEPYVEHFKKRVLAGLGMSGIDVGESQGSSKSSAEVVSQALVDEVKGLQDLFEDMFNSQLVRALLLESTFDFDTLDVDNDVSLEFKEIDLTTQTLIENHYVQLFTQHGINHKELRVALGRQIVEADDEDWWETSFWKLIGEPENLIRAVNEPFSPAAQAAAAAPTTGIEQPMLAKAASEQAKQERIKAKSKITSRGARSGASRDRPRNQHKRKSEPHSRTNSLESITGLIEIQDQRFIYPTLYDVFSTARADAVLYAGNDKNAPWFKALLRNLNVEYKRTFHSLLGRQYRAGYDSLVNQFPTAQVVAQYENIRSWVDKVSDRLFKDLERQSISNFTPNSIGAVFDSLEFRVSFALRTEKNRAYNYGRLVALKELGFTKVKTIHDSSHDCPSCSKMAGEVMNIKQAYLLNIPPMHVNCGCILEGANG
jgi:SPP1 gp7 family putative phage head morphogenesis protein